MMTSTNVYDRQCYGNTTCTVQSNLKGSCTEMLELLCKCAKNILIAFMLTVIMIEQCKAAMLFLAFVLVLVWSEGSSYSHGRAVQSCYTLFGICTGSSLTRGWLCNNYRVVQSRNTLFGFSIGSGSTRGVIFCVACAVIPEISARHLQQTRINSNLQGPEVFFEFIKTVFQNKVTTTDVQIK